MHYTRAPIAEAVIDLQVDFSRVPDLPAVEAFCKGLSTDFPNLQRINAVQFEMMMGPGDAPQVSSSGESSAIGFRLTNAPGDRVAQARRNGASFSHMAPYSEWETFSADARAFFSSYVEALGPSRASRLAVRYINRIDLPVGSDLATYFTLTPTIPQFCREVEGYFMQLVLPQQDMPGVCKAIVNTGLEPATPDGRAVVLLDIDVFTKIEMPVEPAALWKVYDALRRRKNDLFESIITDDVRSLIQ